MGKFLLFLSRFRFLQPVLTVLIEKIILPKLQPKAETPPAEVKPIMRRRREDK